MQKNNFLQSDVALYGMFISVALVFSYIESLIPIPSPVPGIKIGIANIMIVWVLYSIGSLQAITVNVVRVLIAGFLFTSLYGILFSMSGAVLSLAVMILLKKTGKFSITGVSIAGGVAHNLGQTLAAVFVVKNIHMFYYFPILMVSGVLTGIVVGVAGGILFKKIKLLQTNVHL